VLDAVAGRGLYRPYDPAAHWVACGREFLKEIVYVPEAAILLSNPGINIRIGDGSISRFDASSLIAELP
jgi:hypothetical protein